MVFSSPLPLFCSLSSSSPFVFMLLRRLWDSGSHMIAWSHKNVSNSIADLRTMLQFQQANGRYLFFTPIPTPSLLLLSSFGLLYCLFVLIVDCRIPEVINWGPQTPEDILEQELEYSSFKFVDLTQMPVLPYSVRGISIPPLLFIYKI